MSRTYRAQGINLKAMPLGETDRLLTILSAEVGLIRVVAPGARKHQSRLGGRSDLFVVNDLLIANGKRLDKLVQAETIRSFPALSQHLARLTASQYLAELVIFQALGDQPQPELFHLFMEHLVRLEANPPAAALPCLTHGIYHLLAVAGIAPDVQTCCITRIPIVPDFRDRDWRVGFSVEAGGIFQLSELRQVIKVAVAGKQPHPSSASTSAAVIRGLEEPGSYGIKGQGRAIPVVQLTALELALLQQLAKPELITTTPTGGLETSPAPLAQDLWSRIERLLRQYAQYHFDQPIRSATLMDACFKAV